MRTYETDATSWRAYDAVLPAELRLGDELPAEEEWSWRDCQVHLDRYAAPAAPATVILLHGGGGHGRLLAYYGRLIRNAGLEAVMPDLPGYGLTQAPPARVRYEVWVELVTGLVLRERQAKRPVVLFGASMGGMLAWHAAAALPPGTVAGIGATTLIDPRRSEVRRAVARLGAVGAVSVPLLRAFAWLLDDVRVPMSLVGDVAAIANDPALARAIARDPQGGGNVVPLGFLRSWMTYEPALEPEAFDRCPVLLAHPGADKWTPTALSLAFYERLPSKPARRFVELPNCGHMPVEQPGLDRLRDELAAFVTQVVADKAT